MTSGQPRADDSPTPAGEPLLAGPVLVTGGSGTVGSTLVRRLLASGVPVRALARSAQSAGRLRDMGAEPVEGDVVDLDGLTRAAAGCQVLFHVAGVNGYCLPAAERRRMQRVNVDGAVAAVRAAADAGVSRMVLTSSAATLGEARGTVGREDSPHRGHHLSEYERTKHEGERAARSAAGRAGVDLVTVNPSSVQGPGRTSGTARLLIAAADGRLPAVVRTRLSVVDLDDCAQGHLLAALRGRPGERYLLSGATLDIGEALALLSSVLGTPVTARRLPGPVAGLAAAAVAGAYRLRRATPPLCPEMMRTLRHGHAYDGSRATRELGLVYTPIEATLRRTLAWYAERGLLRHRAPGLHHHHEA